MKITIRGSVTVYVPRGTYQILCTKIEPSGVGELSLAFEQLYPLGVKRFIIPIGLGQKILKPFIIYIDGFGKRGEIDALILVDEGIEQRGKCGKLFF